jgi:rhodanese-related sulfurtransferase
VVFSCAFALIFNAFYSDGIELKYKEPKKIYLPDFLKAQRESKAQGSANSSQVKGSPAQTKSKPAALPDDTIPRISLVGAKVKFDQKKSVFLDARKNEEYQTGHIAGALSFYSEEIDQYAPRVLPLLPDKKQDIVCYCHGGQCDMALRVAHFLVEQGYTRVEVYQGGWPEWEKAGYPKGTGVNP